MKKALLSLLILVIASLACSFINPSPSETTLYKEYKDDFSSPNSGWDSTTFDDGSFRQYQDDGYGIYVNTPDSVMVSVWEYSSGRFIRDLRIEVDVTNRPGGPVDSYMGIFCRYARTDKGGDFYTFFISNDGFASIAKVVGDNTTYLTEEWVETPAINKGGVVNHIRADCIGDTLALYINEQQVASVTDSDLDGEYVGLAVGTRNVAGADVFFDNFIVTSP